MNEQDSESLDSFRESSAFELAIMTAGSKPAVLEVLHDHDLSEEVFTNRFPGLAKMTQGLPDVPDEPAPPI
ncbi:hypothetical protein OHA37_16850 [Streptomyces sp. NBC_00335]|uniref:hypothetical protein n=1 Tax=unclassified Streptomyces TaxID=2593676 RepID=UPI002259424F|nr:MULTISPECIES: hypothetical protein [unclassified Streptomyces]MCX5405551.1 hypothetical protein [Streptomyces sp. NBC_00086]